jgi:hypothetical protein
MATEGMRVTTNTVTTDVVHLIASFKVLGRNIAAFFLCTNKLMHIKASVRAVG